MKTLKNLTFLFLVAVGLHSCTDDDALIFTAVPDAEGVQFVNDFSNEYLISKQTGNNTAERFVWNNANFEAQTNVSYELHSSLTNTFETFEVMGTTNTNNISVTVRQLQTIAEEQLGLDFDPETINEETGEPNNIGTIYFRVRAFVGESGAANTVEAFSDPASINISLVEDAGSGSGVEIASWGVVGSGYNNWGAFADGLFYTTSEANVLVSYITLKDGEIKFRENNDWGNNLGDDGADGTLEPNGANIVVTAGTYKITLNLNDNTYSIEEYSWGVVGSGYNNWGATPDAPFFYDFTTDTFKVGVRLIDGEIKFRQNNEWNVDFGDNGADGTLDGGGANIAVTAGHYVITLDFNNNTYTIEEGTLWGVVGSGYNDWGGAGPDFTFTEYNPGLWIAENVTLIDGEIKFRINNDWGNNVGDDGADGTLETNGENIAVTAGTYTILLDYSDPSAPTYVIR